MKKWVGFLLAAALMLGMTVPVSAASFSDVGTELWCYQQITDLTASGVIGGYADGSYRPDGAVTCGAALKLVLLACGYSAQQPTGTNVFSGYYDFAVKKNFITAEEMPDLTAEASRLLIARLTAKALGLGASSLATPYADTSDGYAVALYTTGIMQGTTRSGVAVLNASANIKRGEMAAVIWRIQYTDWRSVSRANSHQIAFGGKWYEILDNVPASGYAASGFSRDGAGRLSYQSGGVGSVAGIDVSSHQGTIDWAAVAASGIRFAMIRVGYRGYNSGVILEDASFRQNLEGALAAGLQVGVYFYSQAITADEAAEEAQFVLERVQGYALSYPVVFDWETVSSASARTRGLDRATLTACANAFCTAAEYAGYQSAVYFNLNLAYTRYDLSGLSGRNFWLAEYNAVPTFYYNYQMLQYTSSGSVPGISGRVDLNISLLGY